MTIWRMRIACWITNAKHALSEFAILIAFTLSSVYTTAPQYYVIRTLFDLLFSNSSRQYLGPIQPPVQWVAGHFPWGKSSMTLIWTLTSTSGWMELYRNSTTCPHRLEMDVLTLRTFYLFVHLGTRGHSAGGAAAWGTVLQAGRTRDRFPMVSFEFFIDIILPAALLPRGWLSL
jgi:hypothetical protein